MRQGCYKILFQSFNFALCRNVFYQKNVAFFVVKRKFNRINNKIICRSVFYKYIDVYKFFNNASFRNFDVIKDVFAQNVVSFNPEPFNNFRRCAKNITLLVDNQNSVWKRVDNTF